MKAKRIQLVLSAGLLTALLVLPACAAEGDSLWSRTFGGSDEDVTYSIIPSGDGGFLLAGWTWSFGAGDADLWLVKTNAQGDSLWSRAYGGLDDDEASSVIQTSDGGFLLAGYTSSFGAGGYDMWLVKVNAQGDSLWSRTYGGSDDDWAFCVIPSGDGGFLLAGGTWSFGAGSLDMWLVKVNADGDSLWSCTYGGSDGDAAYSIISSGDGGFLLSGQTWSFGVGSSDMWLVKVNAQGDSLWSHTFGGGDNEVAYSMTASGDGGCLLAGQTWSFGAGNTVMWLVKVDAQGDSLWSRTYGGSNGEMAYSIISSGDGGFLLSGQTWSFGVGSSDMWLVKVNSQGDSLWSRTYGGSDWDNTYSIIPSSNGGFLLAGKTDSFGAGYEDMWLVKVEGPPTAVEPQTISRPVKFSLYPPSPNPFNPSTTLRFELPVASYVRLEVFDVNGRSVGARRASPLPSGSGATPTTGGTWYPAGSHQITFDGSGLPSGLYFAKLTAGNFTQTQKLVLLK